VNEDVCQPVGIGWTNLIHIDGYVKLILILHSKKCGLITPAVKYYLSPIKCLIRQKEGGQECTDPPKAD